MQNLCLSARLADGFAIKWGGEQYEHDEHFLYGRIHPLPRIFVKELKELIVGFPEDVVQSIVDARPGSGYVTNESVNLKRFMHNLLACPTQPRVARVHDCACTKLLT